MEKKEVEKEIISHIMSKSTIKGCIMSSQRWPRPFREDFKGKWSRVGFPEMKNRKGAEFQRRNHGNVDKETVGDLGLQGPLMNLNLIF